MNDSLKRFNFMLDEEIHYLLKKYCLESGTSMREVMTSLIVDELKRTGYIKED